jgi:hypothetical protein
LVSETSSLVTASSSDGSANHRFPAAEARAASQRANQKPLRPAFEGKRNPRDSAAPHPASDTERLLAENAAALGNPVPEALLDRRQRLV